MAKICKNCGCFEVCIYANPYRTEDCNIGWQPKLVLCKDCKWRNTRGCPYMNFNAAVRDDSDYCMTEKGKTMSDREKLISIIEDCRTYVAHKEELVERLVANGVTFQKWIPVSVRLPEALEENKGKKIIPCLVAYTPYGNGRLVTQFRQRRFSEDYGWYWPKMGSCNITHWMPLPEPPKEE